MHPPGSQLLLLCPSCGPGNVRGSGSEARDTFVEKAQEKAQDAQERVQQVAQEAQSAAQQEAENQGLTQQ